MFNYKLTRSKRKSISIVINAKGEVTVRAGKYTPKFLINNFVKSKQRWIQKTQLKLQKQNKHTDLEVKLGLPILYLGNKLILTANYPSKYFNIKKVTFKITETNFIIKNKEVINDKKRNCRNLNDLLILAYKKRASKILLQRLDYWSSVTNLKYKTFDLTNAKGKWGSCSSKGKIMLNWRLLMANQPAIDYVVVHELCHLEHQHHQKDFWNLVKKYYPNYKVSQKYLKDNGFIMTAFD